MSAPERGKRKKPFYRLMTVAQIREQKGREDVEVVFLESARFYRLTSTNPRYDEILSLLRAALAKPRVLKVRCASIETDLIEDVQAHPPGAAER